MRRIFFFSLAAMLLLSATGADAQWRYRHSSPVTRTSIEGAEYHNFARTWQNIDIAGENDLLYSPVVRGIAFTTGHSFLVHRRPVLRVVHFGFDVTWFDIEYGNWRRRVEGKNKWMHKVDMSIGAGPAIHINPVDRLGLQLYFHYDPTLSAVAHNFAGVEDDKFELVAGYASYFSTGLALSWDIFSLGGEYRHGGGTYRGIRIPDVTISPENIDQLLDLNIKDALDRQRHRMSGWRVYLSFRF